MSLFLNIVRTPSQDFSKNLVRIKYIQHIQTDLTTCNAAKVNNKIKFLNQAYVFQLIAFWQVFIEELAEYGFKKIDNFENIGTTREKARATLDESLASFNTPKQANINKLFKDTLGIPNISSHWHSANLKQNTAENTLTALLKSRHQIAHTGHATEPMSYETNFQKMKILMQIAELTEKALITQLAQRASETPKPCLVIATSQTR